MAPVVLALRRENWAEVRVVATAQHRHLLDQVLDVFDITPDVDLDIMRPGQSLPETTSRVLGAMTSYISSQKPDLILAQGDTSTVMATALASFYERVPFGHIEAGLRTHDLYNPFPEEMNRTVAGHLASWHFAPTESARQNLLSEGVQPCKIFVTGNTVIDSLLRVTRSNKLPDLGLPDQTRLILVTAHRRENFGEPFLAICRAIRMLADSRDDVIILFPLHPNPRVNSVAQEMLSGHPRILLSEPLDYLSFVAAMMQAFVVLTDSGGIQEEAPALAKPVLVLREATERPEAVDSGVVKLVGTDADRILSETTLLLDDPGAHAAMARGVSPYGDGYAADRIVTILADHYRQSH